MTMTFVSTRKRFTRSTTRSISYKGFPFALRAFSLHHDDIGTPQFEENIGENTRIAV